MAEFYMNEKIGFPSAWYKGMPIFEDPAIPAKQIRIWDPEKNIIKIINIDQFLSEKRRHLARCQHELIWQDAENYFGE